MLGHPFTIPLTVAQRVTARLRQVPAGLSTVERGEYEARVRDEERDRRPPASRAGFDLMFQLPKSASTLWAISDAGVQAQIVRAHHQAIRETLALIEREVLMTRAGP